MSDSFKDWPGKTPPTGRILKAMKAAFVVSEKAQGSDFTECRDLLVMWGMNEEEAAQSIAEAVECGVLDLGETRL